MSQPIETLDLSNDIYLLEADSSVFGQAHQFELEVTAEDTAEQTYDFELRNFFGLDYTATGVGYANAQDSSNTIDPTKVILYILKKVQKAVCPLCP